MLSSVVEELEERCGELTGSQSLRRARRAFEIRKILPSVSDIGTLSSLVSEYQITASCGEVEYARKILGLHAQLQFESDYAVLVDLLLPLEGFSGSQVLDGARYVVSCIHEITGAEEKATALALDTLKRLLQCVAHVTGHDALDRMRRIVLTEGQLLLEKSIPKLIVMMAQCEILEKTPSMLAVQKILMSEASLRDGASDIQELQKHAQVCQGMVDSEALDRSRRAIAAEVQLQSCASLSSQHIKLLLADCSHVVGSSAIDRARRKLELSRSLQQWVPFTLIRSLASKIGLAFRVGNDQSALPQDSDTAADLGQAPLDVKQRMQDLFAEFDTDNSGYIDREEMEAAFDRMGVRLSESEVSNLMSLADEDGTGEIDLLEFCSLVDAMLAKLDSVKNQDDEIAEITRIMEELEGFIDELEVERRRDLAPQKHQSLARIEFVEEDSTDPACDASSQGPADMLGSEMTAKAHRDDAQAIHEARFKMQMHSMTSETHAGAIRKFFAQYQDTLNNWNFHPDHVLVRREWIDAEARIQSLLTPKPRGEPLMVAKKELWENVRKCGELSGSLTLARAQRILEAERELMFEASVTKLVELLQLCGILHGSPAVLNARRLVDAESKLATLMDGVSCCTVPEIQEAVQLCNGLEGSVVIEKARAIILCEAVLEIETRSPMIRRVLSLCECVRDSRNIDRCRFLIRIEMSIAVESTESHLERSLDARWRWLPSVVTWCPYLKTSHGVAVDFMMTEYKTLQVQAAKTESLECLRRQIAQVQVPVLRLSMDVVDVDELWDVLQKCETLTESPVLRHAALIISNLEALPWTHDLEGMNMIKRAIIKEMGGRYIKRARMRGKLQLIFERMDHDGSGLLDRHEIDKAFFELGVNLLPADVVLLFDKYDADQSGSVDFDEFECMVQDLLHGTKWINSTKSEDIRRHLQICGHMRKGMLSERVSAVSSWIAAEDILPQRITSYKYLMQVVETCDALTGSAVLQQSIEILKAASEAEYATDLDTVQDLIEMCGHLDGPERMLQRKRWLAAQERLCSLNYDKSFKDWVSCPYVLLSEVVEDCQGLENSGALDKATKVLAAEAQLSSVHDEPTLRACLKMCGHLTNSSTIEARRKALQARARCVMNGRVSAWVPALFLR